MCRNRMLCLEDRIDTAFFSYKPKSMGGMIHTDHLGTPHKMTDANQAVVWSAYYKPFGAATTTVSTITNNLRFPGQYYDAETGLHYNYYRDYNSVIGRYIEADPIGLKGGINPFIYVVNTPITKVDPYGLDDCMWGGFSGNFVAGVGIQFVKEAGQCKDKCGKVTWKNRNCVCSCVGVSAGGCVMVESGNDSTYNSGWGIGIKVLCLSGDKIIPSGGGGGGGWKVGVAWCWCSCNIN
jgi:RHS repeat-associated protein